MMRVIPPEVSIRKDTYLTWAIFNRIEEKDLDGSNSAGVFFMDMEKTLENRYFAAFFRSDKQAFVRTGKLTFMRLTRPADDSDFCPKHDRRVCPITSYFGKITFWEMQKTYMQQGFHRSCKHGSGKLRITFGKRFWEKRQKEGCENAEIGVQRAMRKTGAQ